MGSGLEELSFFASFGFQVLVWGGRRESQKRTLSGPGQVRKDGRVLRGMTSLRLRFRIVQGFHNQRKLFG